MAGPPRSERRSAQEVVEAAWHTAIAEVAALKTTADPSGVPCPECHVEVDWSASRCPHCGIDYCSDTRRHRARIYEGLVFP